MSTMYVVYKTELGVNGAMQLCMQLGVCDAVMPTSVAAYGEQDEEYGKDFYNFPPEEDPNDPFTPEDTSPPTPEPEPKEIELFDIEPFTIFFAIDMAEGGGEVAGYPYSSDATRFSFSVKTEVTITKCTIADAFREWSVAIPASFSGILCGVMYWRVGSMSVNVWGDGLTFSKSTTNSGKVSFQPEKIINFPGTADELELVSKAESSDYWDTYQYFYTTGGVELSQVKSSLSSEGLSCRCDLVADQAVFDVPVDVDDAESELASPELKLLSEDWVWGNDAYSTLSSESPGITVTINPADCYSAHYSEEPETCTGGVVNLDDAEIPLESEVVPFTIPDIVPADAKSFLFSENPTITEKRRIAMETSRIFLDADGSLFIGTNKNTVYGRDGDVALVAEEVGAFSTKTQISGIYGAQSRVVADAVGTMKVNYHIAADDASIKLEAEDASPDILNVDNGVVCLDAETAWGWVDDSAIALETVEVKPEVSISALDGEIRFKPKANPTLSLSIVADDGTIYVMTKTVLEVDDCRCDVVAPQLAGNKQYRRYYV